MRILTLTMAVTAAFCTPVLASGAVALTLKNHKFSPAEIHVRANAPSVIAMSNEDATAEEFDSKSLKVEKVVAGNSTGNVHLRPLSPGRYPFMGEFHSDTAQGVVIAE